MASDNHLGESRHQREINASSIVDLKAELFRKQLEYQQRKATSNLSGSFIKSQPAVKKLTLWTKKNGGVADRMKRDAVVDQDTDVDELEASRKALEAKTKVYERLSKTGDNIADEDGESLYLVDFEKKFIDQAMEHRQKRLNSDIGPSSGAPVQSVDDSINENDQWVDYVDSLGRSRRCMKKDLEAVKERDILATKETAQPAPGAVGEGRDLLSEDMRIQLLREKWEQEQRELLERGQDEIHYSNVQFDEQRAHGVGFYQFSKDEEARREEMEKLQKLRDETKVNREAREKLKQKRKVMLQARLEKVRARRIAQGKPVPELVATEESSDEDLGPSLSEASQMVSPPPSMVEIREPKNKQPTREWDLGKPGVIPDSRKRPKGWINPKDIRDEEFAPPSFYYSEPKIKPVHSGLTQHEEPDNFALDCDQYKASQHHLVKPREQGEQFISSAIFPNKSTLKEQPQAAVTETVTAGHQFHPVLMGQKHNPMPAETFDLDHIPLPFDHIQHTTNSNKIHLDSNASDIGSMIKLLRHQH